MTYPKVKKKKKKKVRLKLCQKEIPQNKFNQGGENPIH